MLELKHSLIKQSDLNSSPAKFSLPTNEQSLVNLLWISLELRLEILMKCVAAAKMCLNVEIKSLYRPLNQSLLAISLSLVRHPQMFIEWGNKSISESLHFYLHHTKWFGKLVKIIILLFNWLVILPFGLDCICFGFSKIKQGLTYYVYRLHLSQIINLCDHLKLRSNLRSLQSCFK